MAGNTGDLALLTILTSFLAKQAAVCYADLPGLNDGDLQAMGVRALGHRRKIMTAAAQLAVADADAEMHPADESAAPAGQGQHPSSSVWNGGRSQLVSARCSTLQGGIAQGQH